jgi:hypothetical protein
MKHTSLHKLKFYALKTLRDEAMDSGPCSSFFSTKAAVLADRSRSGQF